MKGYVECVEVCTSRSMQIDTAKKLLKRKSCFCCEIDEGETCGQKMGAEGVRRGDEGGKSY